jgi:hypothetical protein
MKRLAIIVALRCRDRRPALDSLTRLSSRLARAASCLSRPFRPVLGFVVGWAVSATALLDLGPDQSGRILEASLDQRRVAKRSTRRIKRQLRVIVRNGDTPAACIGRGAYSVADCHRANVPWVDLQWSFGNEGTRRKQIDRFTA